MAMHTQWLSLREETPLHEAQQSRNPGPAASILVTSLVKRNGDVAFSHEAIGVVSLEDDPLSFRAGVSEMLFEA